MKYGYSCKCGWVLRRGRRMTREQYALAKQDHAADCTDLQKELARTAKKVEGRV